jgi:hypothetical protein
MHYSGAARVGEPPGALGLEQRHEITPEKKAGPVKVNQ